MHLVSAVCLALGAAALFGWASVYEQRSAKQVAPRRALAPRLLIDLLQQPLFFAAIGLNLFGSLLQIFALHLGTLSLVQPLIALNLLFAVVIAASTYYHRAPDRVLLAGAASCAIGVGGFLAIARPGGGAATMGAWAAFPLATGLAALVAGCLAAARWGPRPARPLWLALACGIDFGVTALLLKVVPSTLGAGFADPLRQWPLYMLVIVGPIGFLLNQNAFQAGTLIAPVLAVITTADPLVSITVGVLLLHEGIATSPLALTGEVLSLGVLAVGIVALAHRAPHVAPDIADTQGQQAPRFLGQVPAPSEH